MLFNDSYHTIKADAEGIFRDKGSKFLAFAYPLSSFDEVKPYIQQLKSLHPKANHHCWAARLTPDENVFKLNDDGEPSGTAGRPILNALKAAGLTNILLVVVRYFGGTLLGVPGLIHAYRTAANEALSTADIIENTVNDVYELFFDPTLMNHVMRIIKEENVKVVEQTYNDGNVIIVSVRKMMVSKVIDQFSALHGVRVKYLYTV